MRLLNVDSHEVKEFINEETIPSYAILSHRWEEEEVTFQDLILGRAAHKKGFQKITNFCRIAKREGLQYAWIDTCCIDKTSSAELSEAINSMFSWYKEAEVCFAYLSDCDYDTVSKPESTQFHDSKWFTRAWTLQELIAPLEVIFLSGEWKEFGTRRGFHQEIRRITMINRALLLDPTQISRFCIAEKMSWAAGRKATRPEDRAYSLLGLFRVNMPLLYGEGGDAAFLRLQLEILKRSDDQSLLVWASKHSWQRGVLAQSPDNFDKCHHIRRSRIERLNSLAGKHPSLDTIGIRLEIAGPYIKMTAPSIRFRIHPYERDGEVICSKIPPGPLPAWFQSVKKQLHGYGLGDMRLAILEGCRHQGRLVGILILISATGAMERLHRPPLVFLPKDVLEKEVTDLKEMAFLFPAYPVEYTQDLEFVYTELRTIPAPYRLWRLKPGLCKDESCSDDHCRLWCTGEEAQSPSKTFSTLRFRHSLGMYPKESALTFRTACGKDALPPIRLAMTYTAANDVSFSLAKGPEVIDDKAGRNPPLASMRKMQAGSMEFDLIRDLVVVVRSRQGQRGIRALHVTVEQKETGADVDIGAAV